MTRRYALRDEQWERIKDLLPGRQGHVGVTAQDNRLFVEAVLYRYSAVDKQGKTVDFLLTAKRGKAAALRFFDKAMQASGVPEKITMDKSGPNKAAMDEINARGETLIIVRQVKYLNNIVKQDHRAVKRVTKPVLNFKSFQVISSRQNCPALHRTHAYDSQRSAPAARLHQAVFC